MRGFTLLELMFVLAAAAILLSVGLPSYQSVMRNARLNVSVNDVVASMQLARSEAVKRRGPVVICTSGGGDACDPNADWHQGWIVWSDDDADGARAEQEQVLQRRDSMRRDVKVRLPGGQPMQGRLTYAPTGFPIINGTGAAGIMVFCDDLESDRFGRVIFVPQTGRPAATHVEDNEYGATCAQ